MYHSWLSVGIVTINMVSIIGLLRWTIVDRTYGIHKNLYIQPFLLTVFGPINYGPP